MKERLFSKLFAAGTVLVGLGVAILAFAGHEWDSIAGVIVLSVFVVSPFLLLGALIVWLARALASQILVGLAVVGAAGVSIAAYESIKESTDAQAGILYVFLPIYLCGGVFLVAIVVGVIEMLARRKNSGA